MNVNLDTIYLAGLFIILNGLFDLSRHVLWLFPLKSKSTLAGSEKKTLPKEDHLNIKIVTVIFVSHACTSLLIWKYVIL